MTISTTRVRELDIETIIRRSYQLAGLMNANENSTDPNWAAKFAMAADFLDVELKGLQANSAIARHKVMHTVPVVAGTAAYTLTASVGVLDVVGNGMYKVTGSDQETPVIQVDMEGYQAITDKTTSSRPTGMWFQRGVTSSVTLWPVPSEAGTLTLIVHQLIADGNVQADTVDLERHWTKYLIFQLAHWLALANTLPIATVSKFESLAEQQFKVAKGYSKSSVPSQIVSVHTTAWSR